MAPRVNGASGKLERTSGVIDANSTYTIMAWVYLVNFSSSTTPYLIALSDGTTNNVDAFLARSAASVQVRVSNGGTTTTSSGTTTMSTGTWYHIAMVREDNTTCRIYLNGSLEVTNTRTAASRATITRNELGGAPSSNSAQARYYGMKAWTTALTAGEILSEMRTLKPTRYANLYEFWPGLPGSGFRGKGFSGKNRSWTESGTITDEAPYSIPWGNVYQSNPPPSASGGQTITVPYLSDSSALYAPTLTAGAVTITVPYLDETSALYAPTASASGGGPAPILEIDHETADLSQYDSTTVSGTNASATASTSAAKNGSYGLRAYINNTATDTSNQARGNKAYTANTSNLHYVQFWVRLTNQTTYGYASAVAKGILRYGNDTVNGATDSTARAAGLVFVGVNTLQLAVRPKNGTDTLVGSSFTLTDNTWYQMRVLIDQTTSTPVCTWWSSTDGITFTERATYTDSTSGSNGLGSTINNVNVGLVHLGGFEKNDATVDIDDVEIYDEEPGSGGGAGTITVPYLDASSALYNPTLTAGTVTITVPYLDASDTLYTPLLVSTTGVPFLADSSALYAPTLTSAATITVPYLTDSSALYNPTLTSIATITVPFLSDSSALYNPTLTSAATITVNYLSDSSAVYQPTLTAGVVTISVPYLTDTSAVYEPSATGAGTSITVPYLDATDALYNPTLTAGVVTVTVPYLDETSAVYTPVASSAATITVPYLSDNSELYAPELIGATAGTINVPYLTDTSALYNPTLTAGTVTITVPFISDSSAVYEPTSSSLATITVPYLADSAAVYTPVLTSAYTLSIPFISDSSAVYTPVLTAGAITISVPYLGDTSAVYEPVSSSLVTIAVPYLADASAVYTPVLTATYTISAPLIDDASVVYSPLVAAGTITVTVPYLDETSAVYQPTVIEVGFIARPVSLVIDIGYAYTTSMTMIESHTTDLTLALDTTATITIEGS